LKCENKKVLKSRIQNCVGFTNSQGQIVSSELQSLTGDVNRNK